MNWKTGVPSEPGYYLTTWQVNGRSVVSELWCNIPDQRAEQPRAEWWSARGYLNQSSSKQIHTVIAWAPMPEPYTP